MSGGESSSVKRRASLVRGTSSLSGMVDDSGSQNDATMQDESSLFSRIGLTPIQTEKAVEYSAVELRAYLQVVHDFVCTESLPLQDADDECDLWSMLNNDDMKLLLDRASLAGGPDCARRSVLSSDWRGCSA